LHRNAGAGGKLFWKRRGKIVKENIAKKVWVSSGLENSVI
jgi:hypothetical protein